jgi:hypothetical protein
MKPTNQIPIWFFIGGLLAVYGVLILAYGVFALFRPPAAPPALAELHPDLWWGGLLIGIGGFYTVKYWPWKE